MTEKRLSVGSVITLLNLWSLNCSLQINYRFILLLHLTFFTCHWSLQTQCYLSHFHTSIYSYRSITSLPHRSIPQANVHSSNNCHLASKLNDLKWKISCEKCSHNSHLVLFRYFLIIPSHEELHWLKKTCKNLSCLSYFHNCSTCYPKIHSLINLTFPTLLSSLSQPYSSLLCIFYPSFFDLDFSRIRLHCLHCWFFMKFSFS